MKYIYKVLQGIGWIYSEGIFSWQWWIAVIIWIAIWSNVG